MSKYRIFEKVPSLDNIKTGDLLALSQPNGNTVRGFVTTIVQFGPDSPFSNVFFDDGRSYVVSEDTAWCSSCQFKSAWRPVDPDKEAQ